MEHKKIIIVGAGLDPTSLEIREILKRVLGTEGLLELEPETETPSGNTGERIIKFHLERALFHFKQRELYDTKLELCKLHTKAAHFLMTGYTPSYCVLIRDNFRVNSSEINEDIEVFTRMLGYKLSRTEIPPCKQG